ncbi:hypothetical protein RRG08_046982 [Elysia crispata]|uniref:Fibronectin type-III domain-containing protein n=1 Tax=Elysia crispata TaxID=231223 RepID=A0AAE1A8C7_9GAST|nr:hypothetical protein RRG08_046982 [Elysia crispata]
MHRIRFLICLLLVICFERTYGRVPKAERLRATAQDDGTVAVTWYLPSSRPAYLLGFKVFYRATARQRKWPMQHLIIKTPETSAPTGSSWQAVLRGLKPSVNFEIFVRGFKRSGYVASPTGPITVLSKKKHSSPVATKLKATPADDSISLTWHLPGARPASLLGFKISYRSAQGSQIGPLQEMNISAPIQDSGSAGTSWRAVLDNLKTRLKYRIVVRAILPSGYAAKGAGPIEVFLKEPAHVASNLRAAPTDEASIVVTWKLAKAHPSSLIGFKVFYRSVQGGRIGPLQGLNITAPVSDSGSAGSSWKAVLSSLQTRLKYRIVVRAILPSGYAAKAAGPIEVFLSEPLHKASNLRASPTDQASIIVTWQLTQFRPSSLVGFKVAYRSVQGRRIGPLQEVNITTPVSDSGSAGSSWKAVLRNLQTRLKYRIVVRAILPSGYAAKAAGPIEVFLTEPLHMASNLRASPTDQASIIVTWQLTQSRPSSLVGFKVAYRSVQGRRIGPLQEVNITAPVSDSGSAGSSWKAVLSNLQTRLKYRIAVRAILTLGYATKASGPIEVFLRQRDPVLEAINLEATPTDDACIVVMWQLTKIRPSSLIGFSIDYRTVQGRRVGPKQEVNITAPISDDGSAGSSWKAMLSNLQTGLKYKIVARPIFESGYAKKASGPIEVFLRQRVLDNELEWISQQRAGTA